MIMRKALYLAVANMKDYSSGVTKKIISQCNSFKNE